MSNRHSSGILLLPLGVGAVLLALSQAQVILSPETRTWLDPYDGLFAGMNIGITLLLVAAGHLGARCLLRARAEGRASVARRLAQFVLPVFVLQIAVLAASAAVGRWDSKDDQVAWSWDQAVHIATFRANFFATASPLLARPDLTVLVVLSLMVQMLLVLGLLVLLLPPRWLEPVLLISAAAGFLAVVVLRARAVDFQDWLVLSLDTTARSDAFLLGVVGAVLVRHWRTPGSDLAAASFLAILGTVLATDFVTVNQQLAYLLPAVAVAAALFFVGAENPSDEGDLIEGLGRRLGPLCSTWLSVTAWSGVVALTVARHTGEMHWSFRLLIMAIVLTVVVRVSDQAVKALQGLVQDSGRGQGRAGGLRELLAAADELLRS